MSYDLRCFPRASGTSHRTGQFEEPVLIGPKMSFPGYSSPGPSHAGEHHILQILQYSRTVCWHASTIISSLFIRIRLAASGEFDTASTDVSQGEMCVVSPISRPTHAPFLPSATHTKCCICRKRERNSAGTL